MRKIVAGEFVSADGVMESPDKWHFPYWSDDMGAVVGEQMANADAILLGRVTFQEFASFWPDKQEDEVPGAAHMNGTRKHVVSTTIDDVSAWQNSSLVTGDVAAEIRKLKDQDGGDISVIGSATLVQWLLREGLLDELHLLIHPVSLGSGKRILDEKAGKVPLRLIECRTLPNGVLYVIYGRDTSAAPPDGAARAP